MAGGQAEPPMTVRFRLLKRRPLDCTCISSICQMVGTPALKVTCSASISSYSDLPSSCGPGKTTLQPVMAMLKGVPQALTWNMGTTGMTASRELSAMASGITAA